MIFENIIGNEKNKKLLEDIITKNKIANAYMFIGQESIGKFLFAKEFAKAILCLNENKPCNKCKSCLELENSNNPDLTIIEPDGNNVKIEQIRELNKKVVEKPIVSTKKVYIINDGQNITKEAQNALLKTLEEPPEYVTIILITTSESAFLPTIKSRCTKINFNKLTKEEMLNILKNKYNYQNIADIVYKISNGSINKSIQVIERQSEFETINKTFSNLENTNIIDLINSKEEIFKDKEEINNFKRRWRQKSLPSYMTRILVQSVQAYHRREYALTVSALSTLWEGIIQQKMNDNSYRISRKTRENLSKLIEENEFDKIFSSFCDEFIFYNCIKPEDVKSDVPGRHGIAHCWYDTYPNRKMALNAIIFTDFLLELKPIEKNL